MEMQLTHIGCPNTTPNLTAYVGEFKVVVIEGSNGVASFEYECATCGVRVVIDWDTPKHEKI